MATSLVGAAVTDNTCAAAPVPRPPAANECHVNRATLLPEDMRNGNAGPGAPAAPAVFRNDRRERSMTGVSVRLQVKSVYLS
ncbi:MAG: hypothetical protein R3F19_20550 [Verrucomicrobiales bacterium]